MFKEGQHPVIKEDSEYPEWLWIADKSMSRKELEEKKDELLWETGGRRLLKMYNKDRLRKKKKF